MLSNLVSGQGIRPYCSRLANSTTELGWALIRAASFYVFIFFWSSWCTGWVGGTRSSSTVCRVRLVGAWERCTVQHTYHHIGTKEYCKYTRPCRQLGRVQLLILYVTSTVLWLARDMIWDRTALSKCA
ncbi:hypothetical protein F5Y03DRAFT_346575 [Xylaria venustula]|nr:hypothetical protein F5Y03DRAFT_346575 [Xylaria venustula]